MTGTLTERGNLDRLWEDTGRRWPSDLLDASTIQGMLGISNKHKKLEEARNKFALELCVGASPRPALRYLDVRFLDSRNVK